MRRDDDATHDAIPAGESERPIDLSALRASALAADAGQQPRLEGLARRIEAAAAPELARRRAAAPGLTVFLARARRPALLAAAAAAAFAVATARMVRPEQSAGESQSASVAQALRLDEPAASWIVAERAPSADDLAREIGLDALSAEVSR